MTDGFLNQAGFARRLGVSRPQVTYWKQRGLLVFSKPGLIDVAATERKMIGHFGVLPGNGPGNKNRQPS